MSDSPSIILFDGTCNFCASCVRFVVPRDPHGRFKFASLQSPFAKALLTTYKYQGSDLTSVILVEQNVLYSKSTAALRIARQLSGPVSLIWGFMVVPRGLRDPVYDYIGRHRYQWFGQKDHCWIPEQDISNRFVEEKPKQQRWQ